MVVLYNILMIFGVVLGFPLIVISTIASKKRRKTVLHRLGIRSLPESVRSGKETEPEKKPIWVHALSVGEVLSAIPLIQGLKNRYPDRRIAFSVSTKTGSDIAQTRVAEYVKGIFFFPYDFSFSVKHAVKEINPALVIIVETDIWPNFLFEMKKRNVPVLLVNARLSRRSFAGYRRTLFFMAKALAAFSKICTQSQTDARRFVRLGVPERKITVTGNFKFDQEYPLLTENEAKRLGRMMHLQPSQAILLAGSTHSGEEAILFDAFSRLKRRFPELVLIVAPRDPQRAESICRMSMSAGLPAAPWKKLAETLTDEPFEVIVVNTIGLLTRLYALSDIAYIGGSLVNAGGHNPLEPAAFSKPILFGPDMSDFDDISRMLVQSGGGFEVRDADGVCETVSMLLGDREKAGEAGHRAFEVFDANKGAVEKVLNEVERFL